MQRIQHKLLILALVGVHWVILARVARGQDMHFTQPFSSPLYMTPSYAGASTGHRAILAYRDQWSFMPNMYRTLAFSYDVNIAPIRSGLGLVVMGDLAGDGHLGTVLAGLTYSYSVAMTSSWSFRPGIAIYYRMQTLNFSRLVFGDQLYTDPITPQSTAVPTQSKPLHEVDASLSLLFHSENAWIGTTWDHIMRPKTSFYGESTRLPFKFSLFGGYRFVLQSLYRRGVDQSISIAANARLQHRYAQLDIGGYWFKYPLLLGIWYRGIPLVKTYVGTDAVCFMVGCQFYDFQVAYSYDLTLSRLGPSSGGSHEVSLLYERKITPRRRRFRAPTCPPW